MSYSIQEILEIVEREGDFQYTNQEMFSWDVHSFRFKLHKVFRYDFETGKLYSKVKRNKLNPGDEVGKIDKKGYLYTCIAGKSIPIARIIMIMFNDEFDPSMYVDHKDQNTLNNRIQNLRMVTIQENGKNRKLNKNNNSGYVGIYWYKKLNKWRVTCKESGKKIHGGSYIKIEDAIKARDALYEKHGFYPNHGRR